MFCPCSHPFTFISVALSMFVLQLGHCFLSKVIIREVTSNNKPSPTAFFSRSSTFPVSWIGRHRVWFKKGTHRARKINRHYLCILSRVWVTLDGVLIGDWIHGPLAVVTTTTITLSLISTLYKPLQGTLILLSLLHLYQSFPGKGFEQCGFFNCTDHVFFSQTHSVTTDLNS
jgi:hypothetical protein